MKKSLINVMLILVVLSSTAISFSGCASSSYSKGFDEAD